ncbi:MAG: sigma-70 family RNA polymerase sigma factor [Candidatus Beckwithbacteria bacterium]|nr:sigma-70 family RNA polymerase sigma factor [Patescibacteria group bacterium]
MEKLQKELLSKRFRSRLMNFVLMKVSDLKDAEEIVQDTLIGGLDSLPRFRGESELFTFVAGIARHEVIDFYRRKKIKQILFSRLPFLKRLVSEALGPELAYQELEQKRKIVRVLKTLSEGYAQVLRLKYIQGFSMKEIALKTGDSVKAIESRLTRARLAFAKVYDKEMDKNFSAVGD